MAPAFKCKLNTYFLDTAIDVGNTTEGRTAKLTHVLHQLQRLYEEYSTTDTTANYTETAVACQGALACLAIA